ncbi:MAG: 50S ribosomal protein L10 [Candidatus Hydrogenedentes bacterium]|nr:50S ribosomal protein L10 [Candidatus Hydrogenedentota bacterium]
MPKQEKIDAVSELKERIEAHQVVVMTKYIGIKAGQVSLLRKKLRDSNVQMKVYKNTLAKRVLDELNLSDAAKFMDGPTAWTFSNDPAAPPKVLKEFNKDVPVVSMTGGILDGKVLGPAQLEALASLPSREVLIGQVVGTIAAPLRNFVGVLSAMPRNLVNVLDQIKKQKEGAAA